MAQETTNPVTSPPPPTVSFSQTQPAPSPSVDGHTIAELQRMATASPVTDKHRYMSVRSFASDRERQITANPGLPRWTHIRPNSVLIAAMGYHWKQGSWQRVVDMMQHTIEQGSYVALQEIQDRCFEPYDALGTMRNEAALSAVNEGFEWLLYVDNDVLPERDTLVRLLNWQLPILAPYVVEPGTGRRLFGPGWDPNSGLKPAKWCVLSMLLMRTSIFNCVGPRFWSDAVGADEGYHFQTLWHYGHQPWIDTNTPLVVAGIPHYPLASNRLTSAQRAAMWDKINAPRNEPPDRRPITTDAPNVIDGEYLPFAPPPGTEGVPKPVLAPAPDGSKAVANVPSEGWSAR